MIALYRAPGVGYSTSKNGRGGSWGGSWVSWLWLFGCAVEASGPPFHGRRSRFRHALYLGLYL